MLSSDDEQPLTDETALPDQEYEYFKQKFKDLTGVLLDLYKEKQMKRRINTYIERKGFLGYEPFLLFLQANSTELTAFLDYITINVTEFFRTPEHWESLENEVLPGLLEQTEGRLKIWSCACSTGEEPYSLAMSLCRLADPSRFHILATDIDDKVLRYAGEGLYSAKSTEKLSENTLNRFFVKQGAGWSVSDELRSCVSFKKMDLLKESFPTDCDLIACRNVLIYFTEEAKAKIYQQLKSSLKQGGYLFTGNTEQIIYYKKYGFEKIKGFLYRNI